MSTAKQDGAALGAGVFEGGETGSARGVHKLFELQASRHPERIAAIHGSARFTYREINARANYLAMELRRLGAGPECPVGIFMGRSCAMVSALLAVLKSGAAYVPLDPKYPGDRLSYMLADSGAKFLLTDGKHAPSTPESSCMVIDAEGYMGCWRDGKDEKVESSACLQNRAYIIYTSGSTGRAKGVDITHRSVLAFLDWCREVFTDEELAGMLASTSICFDLSIFEIFGPLSWGGSLYLAENVLELPLLPCRDGVRVINTVPSAMSELLRANEVPPSIETVNLAGEALSGDLVRRIFEKAHIGKVFNLYGPTEDTTYSTYTCLTRCQDLRVITIGRPIANTRGHVLDEGMREVGDGVVGELYLGGAGLARGYVGRGELTAERFVPDPFGGEAGARLYRTGDMVRRRADGELEYLGRRDQQVKIRGYRIELGEIEAELRLRPGVREAVVAALERPEGGKALVGYVVLGAGAESVVEMRRGLAGRLPEYMVPSALVVLEKLPLTPNGKVDRKALPEPEGRWGAECGYVAPRSEVERVIAAVWGELLGMSRVGAHDQFFVTVL